MKLNKEIWFSKKRRDVCIEAFRKDLSVRKYNFPLDISEKEWLSLCALLSNERKGHKKAKGGVLEGLAITRKHFLTIFGKEEAIKLHEQGKVRVINGMVDWTYFINEQKQTCSQSNT